jgi:hypothetical protein
MAFDFLGTFNQAMFDRLRTFIQSQAPIINSRISHLEAEAARIGVIQFKYDQGVPLGVVSDSTSYIGKLLAAYEVLGGNPLVDLRVRLSTDPVFILSGSVDTGPNTMSNGEVIGAKGLNDGDSATLNRQFRSAFDATIERRFDYLERKIRRALDYYDQLQAEIQQLQKLVTGLTEADFASIGQITGAQFASGKFSLNIPVDGSLGNLITQITQLLNDPTYRAITPDTSRHAELGRDVYAPFSSYDVPQGTPPLNVPGREATSPQRQSGGSAPVKPGQRST